MPGAAGVIVIGTNNWARAGSGGREQAVRRLRFAGTEMFEVIQLRAHAGETRPESGDRRLDRRLQRLRRGQQSDLSGDCGSYGCERQHRDSGLDNCGEEFKPPAGCKQLHTGCVQ